MIMNINFVFFCRFQIILHDTNLLISMASDFSALVENVITCAVCLRHYDEPRMLPCAHTFCLQCIHDMVSHDDDLLECPKLDGTKVHGGEIDRLPSNQVVCDLIKLFSTYRTF